MIDVPQGWLLPVVLGAAPLAALTAQARRGSPQLAARSAGRILAVGALAALFIATTVLTGPPVTAPGFEVAGLASLVLVLVLGMGATVLSYAARALRHEPYQVRFAVAGAAVVGFGTVLVTTTDLVVLALAWCGTTAATLQLVRTGPPTGPGHRILRVRRTMLASDALVVSAVVLLAASTGSTAIADLPSNGPAPLVAGVLLVLAAAARSATAPFHRWLPDTLVAPTPASALLHAGVVNGGAIVLIKLGLVTTAHLPAAALALTLGTVSCVLAEAVMLTRADVKGRLAWSTVAQMSFTLTLCGAGLYGAAALHLVAHGCYKGALFLGAGSNVRALVRDRTAPPPTTATSWIVTAGAFAMVGTGTATALAATAPALTAGLLVPVALATVAAGCSLAAWIHRTATAGQRLAGVVTIVALLAAFTVTTAALKEAIGASFESVGALPAAWVLPVLLALLLVAFTRDAPARFRALDWAWGQARIAGAPALARPLPIRWPERRAGRPAWSEPKPSPLAPALDDGLAGG